MPPAFGHYSALSSGIDIATVQIGKIKCQHLIVSWEWVMFYGMIDGVSALFVRRTTLELGSLHEAV